MLARALGRAGIDAPVTGALHQLITGELPLDDWVAQVRATVPPPPPRERFWRRVWQRMRIRRRLQADPI